MSWLIGIDVGGTFTDFYALSASDGEVRLYKHPSTPSNPSDAIVDGLESMCREFGIVRPTSSVSATARRLRRMP